MNKARILGRIFGIIIAYQNGKITAEEAVIKVKNELKRC